jgi:hypothetical protein
LRKRKLEGGSSGIAASNSPLAILPRIPLQCAALLNACKAATDLDILPPHITLEQMRGRCMVCASTVQISRPTAQPRGSQNFKGGRRETGAKQKQMQESHIFELSTDKSTSLQQVVIASSSLNIFSPRLLSWFLGFARHSF